MSGNVLANPSATEGNRIEDTAATLLKSGMVGLAVAAITTAEATLGLLPGPHHIRPLRRQFIIS